MIAVFGTHGLRICRGVIAVSGTVVKKRSRLRHLGWEQCCHGPTSKPREPGDLATFRGRKHELLDGSLMLRYSTTPIALRKPSW